MWETSYAREPIDYRLFFLRLLKKLWIFPLAAATGAVLVGAIYCFVNFVVTDGYKYRARTIYYVEFNEDSAGKEYEYYNYYTWNELIHTDYFTKGVSEVMVGFDPAKIPEMISAKVESDYRYLYTYSVTSDRQSSIDMEKALSALVLTIPDQKKEIKSIEIIDPADHTNLEDISLIFVGRAFGFGAIIGLIAVCVLSVFYACVDTSVYLPSTLEKRYHIPTLGAPSMKEFEDNCRHFLGDKKKVGFITVDDMPGNVKEVFSGKDEEVALDIRSMKKLIAQVGSEDLFASIPGDFEKVLIPNPVCEINEVKNDGGEKEINPNNGEKENDPKGGKKTEGCDGLVIVVKAAMHNGKRVERLLEQLKRQGTEPTAFVLIGEDEWLIKAYYAG